VEIKTQNKLKIFIEKPLEKKVNEQAFFFCGGCVLLWVDGKVKKR